MNEFKNAIIKKSSDGAHITEPEFLDYYADVNATLPVEKEEYFVDVTSISDFLLIFFFSSSSRHGESPPVLTTFHRKESLSLKLSSTKRSDKRP